MIDSWLNQIGKQDEGAAREVHSDEDMDFEGFHDR